MSSSAVTANQPHKPFIKKSISFNWSCVGWAYQLLGVMCDAQYNFGFTNMSETAVWCFAGGVAMWRPVGCLFWPAQVTVVIIDRCRTARGMSQPITAEVQWDCSGLKLITAVSWALWLNVSAEIPWDCMSLCHTISAPFFFTLLVFANLSFLQRQFQDDFLFAVSSAASLRVGFARFCLGFPRCGGSLQGCGEHRVSRTAVSDRGIPSLPL